MFTSVNWPTTCGASLPVAGPVLPAWSVTDPDDSDSVMVPSAGAPACEAVTVYGPAPLPDTPVTDQPLDVPPIVKSPAARPVTGPSKVTW
mgnify:CR=1 FL=1